MKSTSRRCRGYWESFIPIYLWQTNLKKTTESYEKNTHDWRKTARGATKYVYFWAPRLQASNTATLALLLGWAQYYTGCNHSRHFSVWYTYNNPSITIIIGKVIIYNIISLKWRKSYFVRIKFNSLWDILANQGFMVLGFMIPIYGMRECNNIS